VGRIDITEALAEFVGARVAWQCALALPHSPDSNPMMKHRARRGLAALAERDGSR
jgi:hypothetical protein